MVSQNPSPEAQEINIDPPKMDLPGLDTPSTPPTTSANTSAIPPEDPNMKVRKPYTITKSRESWTEEENDKFLEALHLFDRDWKKIEAFIGSKTVIQIRSHAQKYFLKVQKNGASEHVPPPRPKKKAAHPYPQKASKKVTRAIPSSPSLVEPGCFLKPNSSPVPGNPVSSAALTSQTSGTVPPVTVPDEAKDDMVLHVPSTAHICSYSSSNNSNREVCPTDGTDVQERGTHGKPMRVFPDFTQVYSFIGSVFDPNASGHLQMLKKMDPVDVEAVLVLMKNLTINLKSPECEDHRRLLVSFGIVCEKAKFSSPSNDSHADKPDRAISV